MPAARSGLDHLVDPPGGGHAGGVGEGDGRDPLVREAAGQGHHLGRIGVALVGRPERARDHGVDRDPRRPGQGGDLGDGGLGLLHRHLHVALVVGGRERDGDRELVDAGLQRQFGAPSVGDQRGVADVWGPADPGQDLGGTGHGGHRLGRHERHRLDAAQSGVPERLDQPDPIRHRHRSLRLEPVAGPDVADGDGSRQGRPGPGRPHQTGGTPWRRSEKWRSFPTARANRRMISARRCSGSTMTSTTSSEARRRMSTSSS